MFPNDTQLREILGTLLAREENAAAFTAIITQCEILTKAQFFAAAERAVFDSSTAPTAATLFGVWKTYEHLAQLSKRDKA